MKYFERIGFLMKRIAKFISIATAMLITSTTGLSVSGANVEIINSKANNNSGVVAMPYTGNTTTLDVEEKLPSSYSSKDLDLVTPIRNQGKTEICWAYGGLNSFETMLIKNGVTDNSTNSWLSSAHADAWATPRSDGTGWIRSYNGGGFPYITMGYLTSWSGAVAENEFPYTNQYELFDINKDYNVENVVTGIMYLNGDDKDTIKKSIMDYGAVTTNYNSHDKFTTDKKNTYCPQKTPYLSGHCVSVVGWDDNYSKDNFQYNDGNGELKTPENDGAWLCKNSWGNYNNLGGYFWISYEDYYVFSDVFGPSYTYTDYMHKKDTDTIHQVETFGATYEFNYLDEIDNNHTYVSKDTTYVNVLNIENENEYLDKVLFESTSTGADYTIYYIPIDDEGTPSSDKTTWKTLKTDKVPYSGYYTADIEPQYVSKGKIGIGVEINTKDTDILNGIGVSEWLDAKDLRVFNTEAKRGQSYIYTDEDIFSNVPSLNKSKMNDVMDFYEDILDDTEGGNFVIKGITYKSGTLVGDANLDGVVNIEDAVCIQKSTVKRYELSSEGEVNADINQDGVVNVKDSTEIQKLLAKVTGDNQ